MKTDNCMLDDIGDAHTAKCCPACNSFDVRQFSRNGIEIARCLMCSVEYSLRSDEQNYQTAYSGGDSLYRDHFSILDHFQTTEDVHSLLLPFERRILERVRESGDVRSMLDLGCGTGRFLRAAESLVPSVVGYEVADILVDRLKGHGRNVVQGGIEEFIDSEGADFDAVCLLEVVEHLESPGRLILELLTKKRPRYLFVVVPDSITRCRFDGRFARHDVPPNHLTWWNTRSLSGLLGQTGYQVQIESIAESRRSLAGHFYRRLRGESAPGSLTDWLSAFVTPPSFWLLATAKRV